MTTMHAASGHLQQASGAGIRPFDIGRDLRPVAELIAEAFASELDQRGNAALREMRVMSHMGGFLKLLNRTTGDFNDVFNGYVWEEEGRLVGNVTVQKSDRYGNRWQIANVAVAPAYRGRGIARKLMDQALDHIDDMGGRWAVLQVYQRNTSARHLYEALDFEYLGGLADLRLAIVPPHRILTEFNPELQHFYGFSAQHWQELYELANFQLSSQAQWWRGVRRSDFQESIDQQFGEWFSRTIGRRNVYRRCIQAARRFEAALILTAQRWSGEHQLKLWVRPDHYGQVEEAMMQWVLKTLDDYPRLPVTLELSTLHEAGMEAARRHGFEVVRSLMTMRRKICE